jgi:hypothetical protein
VSVQLLFGGWPRDYVTRVTRLVLGACCVSHACFPQKSFSLFCSLFLSSRLVCCLLGFSDWVKVLLLEESDYLK